MRYVLTILFTWLLSLTSFASEEAPQTFTLDGKLYSDSAATIPLADVVSLKVQILDPAQACIVYEEVQSVNTTTTSGYYTIQIGQKVTPPAGKRSSGDSNNGLTTIFSNSVSSITGKLLSDGTTVCTYNPTAGDTRYVKFTMTPAGDSIARTTTSNLRLDSVPMALVAERAENLRGLTPSQLLQVNGTTASLTQANIENIFSTLNYPNLVTLLSTAPANYVLKNSNGSTNIPSVAGAPGSGLAVGQIWYDSTNNQLKFYDGAVKVVGSSTAGTLAATAGGTGQSSFAVGDLLYANTTTALARLPASTSGYVLTSNGAGTAPTWQAASGGGGSLSSTTAATTTNSINNANFAQTWNWNSATTESPLTLTSNAITTGSLLSLTSSSAGINSTNGLLNVANSTATTTGTLARFQANSTAGSGITVLNNGNFGIGTSSPTSLLHVSNPIVGATRFSITNLGSPPNNANGVSALDFYAFSSTSSYRQNAIESQVVSNSSNGATDLLFKGKAAATDGFLTEFMRITAGGNVGIGTTAPAGILHVVGINGSGTNNGSAITLDAGEATGTGSGGNINIYGGNATTLSGTNGGSINLTAGAGPGGAGGYLTLRSGNFVSTSTGGAQIQLSASGSITSGGVAISSGAVSGAGPGGSGPITFTTPSAVASGSAGAISLSTGNGQGAGVGGTISLTAGNGGATNVNGADVVINPGAKGGTAADGNVVLANLRGKVGIGTTTPSQPLDVVGTVQATDFVSTSDRRLKRNITSLENSLDKILQINGVSWNWIADGVSDIGVIAQDVEKVFPELVVTNSNGKKSVKYGNLVGPLIEAVKTLNAENYSLKNENAELKFRLEQIERRLEKIESKSEGP